MSMCNHVCMATKTITITLEAYTRLKQLKKDDGESFSDLIIRIIPERRKLSDILSNYEPNDDLAMSIKSASEENRSSTLGEISF